MALQSKTALCRILLAIATFTLVVDADRLANLEAQMRNVLSTVNGLAKGLPMSHKRESNLRTIQACERHWLSISCGASESISIVDANYGRTEAGKVCGHSASTTVCSAPQSQRIVRAACEGRQYCTVSATNGVFGDPCRGTKKYLWVQYRIRPRYTQLCYQE